MISDTRPVKSLKTPLATIQPASQPKSHPTIISNDQVDKRVTRLEISRIDNTIEAKVSINVETLVISPVALFLSVTIIVLLLSCITTIHIV